MKDVEKEMLENELKEVEEITENVSKDLKKAIDDDCVTQEAIINLLGVSFNNQLIILKTLRMMLT